MRSIWRGAINFGMVTIPCKLYTAIEQKDVRFRLVHKKDGAPIVEKRFCSEEDKEVAWDEIDPIYFEKSYYLEPIDVGAKPFNLLRRALDETGRVVVAKVTIRTKQRL